MGKSFQTTQLCVSFVEVVGGYKLYAAQIPHKNQRPKGIMNVTPAQLQEQFSKISQESFELHQELAEIEARSGTAWLEIKKTTATYDGKNIAAHFATNAEVDKLYAATDDGKRAVYLKVYLKGLSHKRTAILSEIKANSGQSW